MNKITFLIYTTNRPCQLDLLIRSIKKYVIGWETKIVAFCHSDNSRFEDGYKLVRKNNPDCTYEDLDSSSPVSKYIDGNYIVNLSGSHVFKDYLNQSCDEVYRFEHATDFFCLPLDLSPKIQDEGIRPKILFGEWLWKGFRGKWGNPLGFCKLFPIKNVVQMLSDTPRKIMGGWIADMVGSPPKMICLQESKIVNLIEADDINTRYLNDVFLLGKRLNLITIRDNIHTDIPMDLSYYK